MTSCRLEGERQVPVVLCIETRDDDHVALSTVEDGSKRVPVGKTVGACRRPVSAAAREAAVHLGKAAKYCANTVAQQYNLGE